MPKFSQFSRIACIPALLLATLVSSTALAEKPAPTAINRIVLPEKIITGRAPRPLAAVEVSRVAISIPLSDPRPDFAKKIESASVRDPFLARAEPTCEARAALV